MLQAMRSNLKGTVAFIIVGFLSFILVGSLLQFSGDNQQQGGKVATIDGRTITEIDLLRAIEGRRQQLIAQLGDQLPPDFLSNERLRPLVLDRLINYNLLVNAAVNGEMTVSDQSLNQQIVTLPQFQVEGKYSSELFRNWLGRMYYTASSFKEILKEDIIAGQIQNSLVNTGFITDNEWTSLVNLAFQTRDFAWITLPLGNLQQQITLTEEEIQAFYDENIENYLSDEKVAVEYIEIAVDDIADTITVDDDAVRQQYQQEVAAYKQQTEREAAHILIEDNEGDNNRVAEVEAALAAGEDFAVLARRYSDDVGSKDAGGVLGFTSGDIFPPAFEEALAALTVGKVSSAITTESGTHFIKLLTVRETQAPGFEEERQRIEQSLKMAQAEALFIESLDILKDLSYNAENLADVAAKISDDKITLTANRAGPFARADAPGILANSAINNAIFSDKVIKEGYASDVIEITEDRAVVVKMTDYQPVRTLTLEEKRSEIEAALTLAKSKSKLAAEAEALRLAVRAGESLEAIAAAQGLKLSNQVAIKRDNPDVNSELLNFVFSMSKPSENNRAIDGAHLSNGDYVLVSLSSVKTTPIDSLTQEERVGLRSNLTQTYSRDEFIAWQSQLRANGDIEIFAEADRANLL